MSAPPTPRLALQSYVLQTPEGPHEFDGAVLGAASSESKLHRGHDPRTHAPRGVKCSACRWLEVTVFATSHGYVVHTVGVSEVPGESDYDRVTATESAFEVVELLTVRRPGTNGRPGETFVPPQYARALAQAASLDDGIREAYVNRAVA